MWYYSGLQLFFYDMNLVNFDCTTRKSLILKPDSNTANTPIDIDGIIKQVPGLMENLSRMIRTGIIEGQILRNIFRQFLTKDVLLATTDFCPIRQKLNLLLFLPFTYTR
jgi:hypothetical protein